jgi:hypothetical protein
MQIGVNFEWEECRKLEGEEWLSSCSQVRKVGLPPLFVEQPWTIKEIKGYSQRLS